jgi:hypothetical protein
MCEQFWRSTRWASSAVTNEFRSGLVGVIVDGDLYSK